MEIIKHCHSQILCRAIFFFSFIISSSAYSQTAVPMSSLNGLMYTENFDSIANWSAPGGTGLGANRWRGVAVSAGTTAAGTLISDQCTSFVNTTGTTSGIGKGTTNLKFLAAAGKQVALDLLINFSGVTVDSLTMDVSTLINTANASKTSIFKVFGSINNGTSFTELTSNTTDYRPVNNSSPNNLHISLKIPAGYNNNATCVFRFYDYSAAGSGNFPIVLLDNIKVTGIITNPNSFYRTKGSGKWNDSTIWQASPDSVYWSNTSVYPTNAARAIVISAGLTDTIASDVTAKRLLIEAGGALTYDNNSSAFNLNITDTTGYDFIIGGTYEMFGNQPTLNVGGKILVNNGGVVKVKSNNSPSTSDDFARSSNVYFASGSVYDWAASTSFESYRCTYFPNALPTDTTNFRISQANNIIGSRDTLRINGIFNAAASVTFDSAGIKYLRNGMTGLSSITNSGTGDLIIDGDTAILNGGNINLNGLGKLVIASNSKATLTSNKSFSTGVLNVNGAVRCLPGCGFVGTGTFNLNAGASLYISNPAGITPTGAAGLTANELGSIRMTTRNFSKNASYIYIGITNQNTGLGLPDTVKGKLEISNTGALISDTVFLSKSVKIGKTLSIKEGVLSLKRNYDITLLSDSNGTANFSSIGDNANITYDTGRVIVERYIATGVGANQHGKSWQFLSTPTIGQTIKASWQENATNNTSNNSPGYGTQITSNLSNAVALGFDGVSQFASMKYYNSAINNWVGIDSTRALVNNSTGYMIFIKGNRFITSNSQTPSPTILRSKGFLYDVSNYPPPVPYVTANSFESIGNPYASIVDFALLTKTGGVQDLFYLWDPKLTNNANSPYGYGGYQTFTSNLNGTYHVSPGSGSYPAAPNNDVKGYIQSGSAFFVHASGNNGGIVQFKESAKADTLSNLVNRSSAISFKRLAINLLVQSSNDSILLDGITADFADQFSNEVDEYDALKLFSSTESISIINNSTKLVVERRKEIQENDTLKVYLNSLKQRNYIFDFYPTNFNTSSLNGILIDRYLNTETNFNLDRKASISFFVNNDSGSYNPERFIIVFRPTVQLPVKFVSVHANVNEQKTIDINWRVADEINVNYYILEKSLDGKHFFNLGKIAVKKSNTSENEYIFNDKYPSLHFNYYRVVMIEKSGDKKYSNVVKVEFINIDQFISIYPNPVKNKTLNIYFKQNKTSLYSLEILDILGHQIQKTIFNTISNQYKYSIQLSPVIQAGNYQIKLSGEDFTTSSMITVE